MHFVTDSGTEYLLTDIKPGTEGGYSAVLSRDGVPLRHVTTGADMADVEQERAFFDVLPTVGESFFFATPQHGGCVSTPVREVIA